MYNKVVVRISNVIGRPATGGDFFDRAREQRQLWRRLEHDNVLLLAPRRVGKTSLLRRMAATCEEHEYRAVYISVADRTREVDFIIRLYDAIAKMSEGSKALDAALRRVRRRLPKLRKIELGKIFTAEFADASHNEWKPLGDALLEALRETKYRWLLLVDELPLFVLSLLGSGEERTRIFLNWFRDVRIDEDAGLAVRWVLAGSIGLDTVVAQYRLGDTTNDLAVMSLGPFSAEDADAFLSALARGEGLVLSDEVRAHIIRKVGWLIPYHLQLVFSSLVERDVMEPSIDDVDAAYIMLLEPTYKSYFDYWVQRLHDELGKLDAGHALALLAAVARDDEGVSRSVLVELLHSRGVEDEAHYRFVTDALVNDGYLVDTGGSYRFRSPLLRDYWRVRVLS